MNLKIKKSLTYEEIGSQTDLSPQQVHKIEKEALNKMFVRGIADKKFTPVEVALGISDYFGISIDQLIKKFDDTSRTELLTFVQKEYGKKIEGFEEKDNIIERLFG